MRLSYRSLLGHFPVTYLSSVSLGTLDADRLTTSPEHSLLSSSSSVEEEEDPEEEVSLLLSLPDPEDDPELDEFCSVSSSS